MRFIIIISQVEASQILHYWNNMDLTFGLGVIPNEYRPDIHLLMCVNRAFLVLNIQFDQRFGTTKSHKCIQ